MLTGNLAKGILATVVTASTLACSNVLAQDANWDNLQKSASMLLKERRFAEAADQFRSASRLAPKAGTNTRSHADSLTGLGQAYEGQGRYSHAEVEYASALEILKALTQKETNAVNSAALYEVMTNIARVQSLQGKYTEAEASFQQVLTLEGVKDGVVKAQTLNDLAHMYITVGKFEQAAPLCSQSLSMRSKLLGVNHASVAQSLNDMALIDLFRNKHQQAEDQANGALFIAQRDPVQNALIIADSSNILARLHFEKDKFDKSRDYADSALTTRRSLLGNYHAACAEPLFSLGVSYMQAQNLTKAEEYFHQSLRAKQEALGQKHPAAAPDFFALAICSLSLGKSDESRYYYQQGVSVREAAFGKRDPITSAYKSMYIKHLWNTGHMLDAVNLKSQELPTFSKQSAYLDIEGRALQKCLMVPEITKQSYSWKDLILVLTIGTLPLIFLGLLLTLPGVFLYLPKGNGFTDFSNKSLRREVPKPTATPDESARANGKLALKAQKDSQPQWTKRDQ